MSERRTLSVDVKVGESLSIDGGRVRIKLVEKSGQRARLQLEMEPDVTLGRPRPGMADMAKRGVSAAGG